MKKQNLYLGLGFIFLLVFMVFGLSSNDSTSITGNIILEEGDACTTTDDCIWDGFICNTNDVCAECDQLNLCPSGSICTNGFCVFSCVQDIDCMVQGSLCDGSSCTQLCSARGRDCPTGYGCLPTNSGDRCFPAECTTDLECVSEGTLCGGGFCGKLCSQVSQNCPIGYWCNSSIQCDIAECNDNLGCQSQGQICNSTFECEGCINDADCIYPGSSATYSCFQNKCIDSLDPFENIDDIYPKTCSDIDITAFWNNIFDADPNSGNRDIVTSDEISNNHCEQFAAYVYDSTTFEIYLLRAVYSETLDPKIQVEAVRMDAKINSVFEDFFDNQAKTLISLFSLDLSKENLAKNSKNLEPDISIVAGANAKFSTYFNQEVSDATWTSIDYTYKVLVFNIPDTLYNLYKTRTSNFGIDSTIVSGGISKKKDFITLTYLYSNCEMDIVEQTTGCTSDDIEEIYYIDQSGCGIDLSLLTEYSNTTESCDYQNRKVIGNPAEVGSINLDFEIEIDGDNYDENETYSGDLDMGILDDADLLIELEWDFSDAFNFRQIEIEKQSSSSSFGYLIVQGIDAEKIFYIDKKLTSSNAVCVEDKESIDGISDISSECSGSSEYIVLCPGTNHGFECEISGDQFQVSGLEHSAVKEIIYNGSATGCTPSWSCTEWSNLVDTCGTRTCTDSNSCGTTISKHLTSTSCPSSGNNYDDTYDDEYYETKEDISDFNWEFGVIVFIIIIAVLAVLGLILHFIRKGHTQTGPKKLNQLPQGPGYSFRQPPRSFR